MAGERQPAAVKAAKHETYELNEWAERERKGMHMS